MWDQFFGVLLGGLVALTGWKIQDWLQAIKRRKSMRAALAW